MKLFKNKIVYFIQDEVKSVKEALVTSCLPLFNNEYINKEYVDEVINQFESNTKSCILNNQVVVLSTKPNQKNVFKNGVSLVYFDKPLILEELKIKFIITVSAVDEDSNVYFLNRINQLLNKEENLLLLSQQQNLKNLVDKLSLIDN